jgi:hypothetical protein
VLNHTAGLQNALASDLKADPLLMCNWDETLKKLAASVPESAPGVKQVYHALTFGWLCGGIIEVCISLSSLCYTLVGKNRSNAYMYNSVASNMKCPTSRFLSIHIADAGADSVVILSN